MRFEFYADGPTVENGTVVLIILISNNAVKRYLTMILEGKISLQLPMINSLI